MLSYKKSTPIHTDTHSEFGSEYSRGGHTHGIYAKVEKPVPGKWTVPKTIKKSEGRQNLSEYTGQKNKPSPKWVRPKPILKMSANSYSSISSGISIPGSGLKSSSNSFETSDNTNDSSSQEFIDPGQMIENFSRSDMSESSSGESKGSNNNISCSSSGCSAEDFSQKSQGKRAQAQVGHVGHVTHHRGKFTGDQYFCYARYFWTKFLLR